MPPPTHAASAIYEVRYVAREHAPRVKSSRYEGSFAYARFELGEGVEADTEQAEEVALRFFAKFPPADLEFWS